MTISNRILKIAAWTAGALAAALALASLGLELFGPAAPGAALDPEASSGGIGLVAVHAIVSGAFALLGALVVSRQPRNAVGWLLVLIGASFACIGISVQLYVQVVLTTGDTSGVVAHVIWVGNWVWVTAMVPAFAFLPLLFPTGRPISPRWRALGWIVLAGTVVFVIASALKPGPLDGAPAVVNPVGVRHPAVHVIESIASVVVLPGALACIASLFVRFRRSSGVERQQLKWVAAAAALLPFAFLSVTVVGDRSWPLILVSLLIVAGAVALAMLRYRLYDIDVVINRTLVYAGLTATLAGAYVGSVLLLQFALQPLTERSDLAVAGSTLAVAALFRPVRGRIQSWVDRRFYRRRYDAERTLAAFSGRLREQLDLTAMRRDLQGLVQETMQPAHVSLWLREQG